MASLFQTIMNRIQYVAKVLAKMQPAYPSWFTPEAALDFQLMEKLVSIPEPHQTNIVMALIQGSEGWYRLTPKDTAFLVDPANNVQQNDRDAKRLCRIIERMAQYVPSESEVKPKPAVAPVAPVSPPTSNGSVDPDAPKPIPGANDIRQQTLFSTPPAATPGHGVANTSAPPPPTPPPAPAPPVPQVVIQLGEAEQKRRAQEAEILAAWSPGRAFTVSGELAQKLGLKRYEIYRVWKDHGKLSRIPMEKEIVRQMLDTGLSVIEISQQTGWSTAPLYRVQTEINKEKMAADPQAHELIVEGATTDAKPQPPVEGGQP